MMDILGFSFSTSFRCIIPAHLYPWNGEPHVSTLLKTSLSSCSHIVSFVFSSGPRALFPSRTCRIPSRRRLLPFWLRLDGTSFHYCCFIYHKLYARHVVQHFTTHHPFTTFQTFHTYLPHYTLIPAHAFHHHHSSRYIICPLIHP